MYPADLADLRRQNTEQQNRNNHNNIPICLSLRDNAACCIPLRDLRNLRENIHARVLNLYCSNETPMSPADFADSRRQTPKTTKQPLPQTTCLSLRDNAACCIPLCVISVICGRITRKRTQAILHK